MNHNQPQQPRNIGIDPALLRAVQTVKKRMLILASVLVLLIVVVGLVFYPFAPEHHQLATIVVAAVIVMVLCALAWWSLHRQVNGSMDYIVLWVAGGFLIRVVLIIGTLELSGHYGLDRRFIALAMLVGFMTTLVTEMRTLSQAQVMTVNPSAPGAGETCHGQ